MHRERRRIYDSMSREDRQRSDTLHKSIYSVTVSAGHCVILRRVNRVRALKFFFSREKSVNDSPRAFM